MLDRLNAILLSLLLILAPVAQVRASQNALLSPTTGTVSGLQLTNNYNNALDSLNTCNGGATAPTNQLSGTPSLGNCWLNTTSGPFPWQVYDGAGWRAPFWVDATNHYTDVKIGGGSASAASASTVDLCGTAVAPVAIINITGTVTITSFGSTCNAGHIKVVTFNGALTMTYNATSLIIPGAANVITAAGDQAVVYALGSGNWQVLAYTPANGGALINPAVDVCDYMMTMATSPPSSKYLFSYGQAISRATYAGALSCSTITQSVTRTNGSPTLTGFSDTTQIRAGAPIEGSGIPTSTTIASCTSTTCTMSANASSSGTANATIFPNGNGDGVTSFNLPNCAGVMMAGRDNMSGSARGTLTATYVGPSPDALGVTGGSQSHTLALSETPTGITSTNGSQSISVTTPGGTTVAASANYASFGVVSNSGSSSFAALASSTSGAAFPSSFSGTNSISVTSNNTGGAAHSIVPPILTVNCMVRVLAMIDVPFGSLNSLASNDNDLPVADRRRSAA